MSAASNGARTNCFKCSLRLCQCFLPLRLLPILCKATMLFQKGAARLATQVCRFRDPRHCGSPQQAMGISREEIPDVHKYGTAMASLVTL